MISNYFFLSAKTIAGYRWQAREDHTFSIGVGSKMELTEIISRLSCTFIEPIIMKNDWLISHVITYLKANSSPSNSSLITVGIVGRAFLSKIGSYVL